MAASYNNEMTIETTIKHILDKIISNVEYEIMDEELSSFDDIDEEPTIGDLERLLLYATRLSTGRQFTLSIVINKEFCK